MNQPNNKTMTAEEFRKKQEFKYDHFTRLTSTGISDDTEAIDKFAEEYAKHYHEQQSKWISVEDNPPENHQDVMVYYYGNRNSKHFPDLQFMKQSSFYNGRFECDEEVTHWQELPEPPTKNNEK